MSNAKINVPSAPAKGVVYAKIGIYCGLVAPMHWHAPYNYWQWPWENHSKPGSAHSLHDVENPTWVDAKTSDPRKDGVKLYKPTAEEKARYKAALKAPEKVIVDGYKAYIKAKASGKPVVNPLAINVELSALEEAFKS